MGRHSKARRRNRQATPRGMVEMVDIRTGNNHLLTPHAAVAGRSAPDRYVALSGADVILAALTDPGTGYCWPCRSSAIPASCAGSEGPRPARLVGWFYLEDVRSEGVTVRWKRGDSVAYVLEGNRVYEHSAAHVIGTIPVLPAGWTDLAQIRELGRRWLRSSRTGTSRRNR